MFESKIRRRSNTACQTVLRIISTHSVLGQIQPTPQNPKSRRRTKANEPSLGMGICEWGKAKFFNFGVPWLANSSLKGPEWGR